MARGELTELQKTQVLNYQDTFLNKRIEYELSRDNPNGMVFKDEISGQVKLRTRTIGDLINTYNPWNDEGYLRYLKKADDPIASDEAGFQNVVFGDMLYQAQDLSNNASRAIPHFPWGRSGARIAGARHQTGGGQTQGTVLPDTDHQDVEEYTYTVKEIVHTLEATAVAIMLAEQTSDDQLHPLKSMREPTKMEHLRDIEAYLFQDPDTLAGVNYESLLRVAGTNAGLVTNLGYTAGDANIYGFDRAASSILDPNMDENAGTPREFSWDLVDAGLEATRPFRQSSQAPGQLLLFTGHDTVERMNDETDSKQRYISPEENRAVYVGGLQGIQAMDGAKYDGGMSLGSYRSHPIVPTSAMNKSGTLSDIVGIYVGAHGVHFGDLMPTTMFGSSDYINLDAFKTKEAVVTFGELRDTNPRAHFSIWDLQ